MVSGHKCHYLLPISRFLLGLFLLPISKGLLVPLGGFLCICKALFQGLKPQFLLILHICCNVLFLH